MRSGKTGYRGGSAQGFTDCFEGSEARKSRFESRKSERHAGNVSNVSYPDPAVVPEVESRDGDCDESEKTSRRLDKT